MDLSMLNREQRIAAETLDGPLLILAGAGSGKTRALTYRVANLIDHGVPAFRILALTFTNKAAREMKSRVEQLIGAEAAESSWISTFHSVCARILRRDIEKLGYSRSFVIYDDDDQSRVIKELYKQLNIDDSFIPLRETKAKISDAKNKLLSPDEWFFRSGRDRRNSMIHDIMLGYEKKLKSLNALDFDDLLLKTLQLFADHPPVLQQYQERFQYILVDEYQDTNKAQYELIRLLSCVSRNICVVGDDDQSIYGWRGADIRNILDFEIDFPDAKVIKLEQNYRSTANILDAANQVIANNSGRKDKKLWTAYPEGEKIHVYCAMDEHDESMWVASQILSIKRSGEPYGSCAILYRTNAQSRVPEEILMRSGIPYRVFGGQKFYERKEIKDILAYLRVIANPSDDLSLSRIINVPKRSIGETTIQAISERATELGIPMFSALNDLPDSLGKRARSSVSCFFEMMTILSAMKESMDLVSFVNMLIEKTGLEEQYEKENTDEALNRLENIGEFRNSLCEYASNEQNATLEGYLENVSLVTDLDRAHDDREIVTMMTLHSAKGLEFDNVFILGLEENIFPSLRSMAEENRLEEERRLMYVGITRAKKRLFLSRASERMLYNQFSHNAQSRFLSEIPPRLTTQAYASGINRGQKSNMPPDYGKSPSNPASKQSARNPADYSPGKPKLTLKGLSLDEIPGVRKGFVPSTAERYGEGVLKGLFSKNDLVQHPKFGKGKVIEVSGSGKDSRIRIAFECGEKELALAIAPIIRIEEEV